VFFSPDSHWLGFTSIERDLPKATAPGRNFAVSKTGDMIAVFRKPTSPAAQPITNLTVANACAGREPPATVK
jgi:hypothetical protein